MRAFAEYAADRGWSNRVLREFLAAYGIADGGHDVRAIAWTLNAHADCEMLRAFRDNPAGSWRELFHYRFEANAPLKRSVARLVLSDSWHPFNTLARTYRTVLAMQECRKGGRAGLAQRWLIVLWYSAEVLAWIA